MSDEMIPVDDPNVVKGVPMLICTIQEDGVHHYICEPSSLNPENFAGWNPERPEEWGILFADAICGVAKWFAEKSELPTMEIKHRLMRALMEDLRRSEMGPEKISWAELYLGRTPPS